MVHRAPSRSRVASAAAVLVLLALLVARGTAQGNCKGIQNYKLTIYMRWTRAQDRLIPPKANVPQVVAVSHTQDWRLFAPLEPLEDYVKTYMQKQKLRGLFDRFKVLKKDSRTEAWDYITKASPTNTLHLNVRLNGDTGATKLSFMGLLDPTPDWFFGINSLELCQGTQFVDKYPLSSDVAEFWAKSYDAGLDNRGNISVSAVPVVDGDVKVDNRPDLIEGYAQYNLKKGSYAGYFPFWKILVIVGCLAIVVLVTFICLYPRCCKKQMLDVPVPLQDESQWAT